VVSFTPRPLCPRGNTSCIYWIGGWVGPRPGLDDMVKRKILTLPVLELRPVGHPAPSQSLYRLRYPTAPVQCRTVVTCSPVGRSRHSDVYKRRNAPCVWVCSGYVLGLLANAAVCDNINIHTVVSEFRCFRRSTLLGVCSFNICTA
jgi:hypothetical protein